jgi:hypothetical protein
METHKKLETGATSMEHLNSLRTIEKEIKLYYSKMLSLLSKQNSIKNLKNALILEMLKLKISLI